MFHLSASDLFHFHSTGLLRLVALLFLGVLLYKCEL